jgi:O-antigen/teichoic acid export membrane protein
LFFINENNKEIGILLKYMVCLTIISGLNIPAFIVILLTEKTKFFSSLVVFANIFYLLIGFFLSYKYGYWGIVIAILICDLIITIANNFMAIKLKLFYSDNKTSIKISEVNIN